MACFKSGGVLFRRGGACFKSGGTCFKIGVLFAGLSSEDEMAFCACFKRDGARKCWFVRNFLSHLAFWLVVVVFENLLNLAFFPGREYFGDRLRGG